MPAQHPQGGDTRSPSPSKPSKPPRANETQHELGRTESPPARLPTPTVPPSLSALAPRVTPPQTDMMLSGLTPASWLARLERLERARGEEKHRPATPAPVSTPRQDNVDPLALPPQVHPGWLPTMPPNARTPPLLTAPARTTMLPPPAMSIEFICSPSHSEVQTEPTASQRPKHTQMEDGIPGQRTCESNEGPVTELEKKVKLSKPPIAVAASDSKQRFRPGPQKTRAPPKLRRQTRSQGHRHLRSLV